jgi:AcrR family transcriptional regulator
MPTTSKRPRPVGRPPDADLQERRRAELLDAATAVFSQRGFAEADVQEIADRTAVGKGTVYRYFASKEDLFLAAVDHGMRRLKSAVDASIDGIEQPLERIAVGIRAYLTFFDEHPEVAELLIHERAHFRDRTKPTYFVHRDANMNPWRDLFRDLVRQGVVRDIPVERITDFVSNLVYGTMFTNYFAGRTESISHQCESILDLLFQGLLVRSEDSSHAKAL